MRGRSRAAARGVCGPCSQLRPLSSGAYGHARGACVALVVSALAMLAVPMAVRRMIDLGFRRQGQPLIDSYFAMLIVIGAGARGRQRAALLFRQLARRARRRRSCARTSSRHLAALGPAFFETTPFRRDHEPAHGGHDADQGGGRHGAEPGRCATPSCWSARS